MPLQRLPHGNDRFPNVWFPAPFLSLPFLGVLVLTSWRLPASFFCSGLEDLRVGVVALGFGGFEQRLTVASLGSVGQCFIRILHT